MVKCDDLCAHFVKSIRKLDLNYFMSIILQYKMLDAGHYLIKIPYLQGKCPLRL